MTLDSPPKQLGNYDIISMIAEGGMGTVYKARNRVNGEIVAIKVIAQGTARNPVLLQRFEREFQAARVLDHPNVVRGLEYCGSGPHPFLVMEYVDGESLGQRIERTGAIPEVEAIEIISQVCDGLQRAHKQGLVHRDIKPDNILLNRDGIAKLTDMGLVKDVDGDMNLTKTGRGLGTPHFMAPEQFRNAKGVDVRCDIYSLGATLYALVTGTIPFSNQNPLDCWMRKIRNEFPSPQAMNRSLSDRTDWAIRRAMSAEPGKRPSSCREFMEDLTGQSRVAGTPSLSGTATSDLWYMVFRDENGQTHTVKGSSEGIRSAIKDNLLGDASSILIGRSKTGQFLPITSIPEFRDLVVSPQAINGPSLENTKVRPELGGTEVVDIEHRLFEDPASSRDNSGITKKNHGSVRTPRSSGSNPVPSKRTIDSSTLPNSNPVPVQGRQPSSTPRPVHVQLQSRGSKHYSPKVHNSRKGQDVTLVLMFVIAILSGAIGYFLLTRF